MNSRHKKRNKNNFAMLQSTSQFKIKMIYFKYNKYIGIDIKIHFLLENTFNLLLKMFNFYTFSCI